MDILKYSEIDLEETIKRSEQDVNNVLGTVSEILENVRVEKDKAIRRKEKIIAILGFLLAAMLITVIAVLVYDKANPEVGWFREIGAMLSYSKTAMKL